LSLCSSSKAFIIHKDCQKTLHEEAVGLHLTGSPIRHANCSSLCELQRSRQRALMEIVKDRPGPLVRIPLRTPLCDHVYAVNMAPPLNSITCL